MHVAVITRHAIINYGSFLQTLATQKAIESLGHTCEIIDYVREDEEPGRLVTTNLKQRPRWNGSLLRRLVYHVMWQPEIRVANAKFNRQRKNELNLSQHYSGLAALAADPPAADVYMTGSDQVWGPVGPDVYDSAYLLSFAPAESRRVAYAASFGHVVPKGEVESMFTACLSEYSHIAVREDVAVQQLAKWGFSSRQVLDPTLLLDAVQWDEFAADPERGEYVLVYQIHDNPVVTECAQVEAESLGLPLVRVMATFNQLNKPGKAVFRPTVARFLAILRSARLLVTDSFHGTAFAINYNVPFVEVLPENGTANRNQSILRLTGLECRIVTNTESLEGLETDIDFSHANSVLEEQRRVSMECLRLMIED